MNVCTDACTESTSWSHCSVMPQDLNYDAAAAEQLAETLQAENAAVRSAKEAVEVLAAQMSSMDFAYRDPERNWNRSRVKGVSHSQ